MITRIPFKLLDIQVEDAALLTTKRAAILQLPTGLGKTIVSLISSCILLEDDLIDHVILECEVSKVEEWVDDITENTSLTPVLYHGPKRKECLSVLPKVLVGVYETIRSDLYTQVAPGAKKAKTKALAPGPLLQALYGKKVLFIQDEGPAKMGANRSSWMYKSHQQAKKLLESKCDYRAWVLSATPMDRDPIGYYNVGRLLSDLGTVTDFEKDHIEAYDPWGNPAKFKNLDLLEQKMAHLVIKRDKDPALFPTLVQDPPYTFVKLTDIERDFITAIYRQFGAKETDGALWMMIRQYLGHPMALTRSSSAMATEIVNIVGDGLEKLPTSKLDALVELLDKNLQSVVFTYFGQSVLPFIKERLVQEGFSVVTSHGQMPHKQRKVSRLAFNSGDAQVFLSSDAGARGVNLPAGEWIIHYDVANKYSTFRQRTDRISRLNSYHSTIYSTSLVVSGTIEEGLAMLPVARQAWGEELGADDGSDIPASVRKQLLEANRLGR